MLKILNKRFTLQNNVYKIKFKGEELLFDFAIYLL